MRFSQAIVISSGLVHGDNFTTFLTTNHTNITNKKSLFIYAISIIFGPQRTANDPEGPVFCIPLERFDFRFTKVYQ